MRARGGGCRRGGGPPAERGALPRRGRCPAHVRGSRAAADRGRCRRTPPLVPRRFRARLTWWKHARYLSRLAATMAAVTVVSEAERTALVAAGVDAARIHVVPNGADGADLARPRDGRHAAADDLSRARSPIPRISRRSCGASTRSCRGCGRSGPTSSCGSPATPATCRSIGCRNRDSVRFTGRLPDVKDAISGSAATVVPLQVGGGTRLKVLESLALGTPVVSTAKGVEGLDVVNGTHVLVGDTAEAIQRPRAAGARRSGAWPRGCRRTGRALVASTYTWRGDWPAAAGVVDAASEGARPMHSDSSSGLSGRPSASGSPAPWPAWCWPRVPYLVGFSAAPEGRVYTGLMFDVPDHAQVLVVGHVIASRAVHSQHDDARAQRRHLPQPGDVDAGAGPGALRAVVRRPVPVVAHRRRRRRRPGPRGDGAAAVAQRRSGAGRVLDRAGRRRLRMDAGGRQVRAAAWPTRRSPKRIYIVEPNTWFGLLRLSVSAAGAGLHADRAGRRLPRAHGARPRGVGGLCRRRARRGAAARLRPGGRLRGRRHVLDRRAGAGPGHPVAVLVGDRGDPRLLGAARRLLPVPDLVGSRCGGRCSASTSNAGVWTPAPPLLVVLLGAPLVLAALRLQRAGVGSRRHAVSPRAGRSSAWSSSTCRRSSR